ncbi:hypothetical protein ASL20_02910 [Cupriavidus necator]|nr:hypothetical protein ASL20_02910 [Cupriavidus necator]
MLGVSGWERDQGVLQAEARQLAQRQDFIDRVYRCRGLHGLVSFFDGSRFRLWQGGLGSAGRDCRDL